MKRTPILAITMALLLFVSACGNSTGNQPQEETTMGQALQKDFKDRIETEPDITPTDMAEALLTNSVIEFSGAATEVESGYLTGFTNEMSGFEEGVMFAPVIGSIPFVGYIFTVGENDVDGFMDSLSENADPRWNICTEADETIVDHVGNMVFFLMCPSGMEE